MPTLRRSSSSPIIPGSLPPIRGLIVDSWQSFLRDWKDTFKTSRWLILTAALLLGITLVDRVVQTEWMWFPILGSVIFALGVNIWVSVRLIQETLIREQKTDSTPAPHTTIKHAIGYLWVKLLSGIVILGASLPLILGLLGLPVLIAVTQLSRGAATLITFLTVAALSLPIIWLGVSLLFAPFLLFEDNQSIEGVFNLSSNGKSWPSIKKTTKLLAQTYELVRGRWWQVFVRLVVPGFIFGLALVASISLADSLIQFVAGPEKLEALFGQGTATADVNSSSNSYAYFLQSVGQALFLPLFTVWQVKLFLALKKIKSV